MFRPPRMIGLLFDCSLQHTHEGVRVIDIIKDQIVQFVRTFEEDDLFYVYHEGTNEVAERRGRQVFFVSSYQTDGFPFDVEFALKQTLYVVASEEECEKHLVFITNRFNDRCRKAIKKVMMLNEKESLGCYLHVFVIGSPQSSSPMPTICCSHPMELFTHLSKEFCNGFESQPQSDTGSETKDSSRSSVS